MPLYTTIISATTSFTKLNIIWYQTFSSIATSCLFHFPSHESLNTIRVRWHATLTITIWISLRHSRLDIYNYHPLVVWPWCYQLPPFVKVTGKNKFHLGTRQGNQLNHLGASPTTASASGMAPPPATLGTPSTKFKSSAAAQLFYLANFFLFFFYT
jgi:hypothetical protein